MFSTWPSDTQSGQENCTATDNPGERNFGGFPGRQQGLNIMITIDLVHEYEAKTEKPHLPTTSWLAAGSRPSEAIYGIAADRHQALLQAARQARLAASAKNTRLAKLQPDPKKQVAAVTRVKSYTRWIIELISKTEAKSEG
jgi:hypothetical protein